jgi:hypothetical protein
MNKLIVLKFRLAAAFAVLLVATGFSQEKFVESFDAGDNMVVSVNTDYTNVIFETWNRDRVEVEAFIEGEDLTKAQKETIFEAWDLNVLGNSRSVVISSNATGNANLTNSLSSLETLGGLDFLGPLLENTLMPILSATPELTETVLRGVSNVDFDYDEFKKDEEGYMKRFEKRMEKNFGKDFERDMEQWGKRLEAEYEDRFGPEWEAEMEAWGDKFGERMEAWGEQFGNDMETWGENFGEDFGKKMEEMGRLIERNVAGENGPNYSRTITVDEHGNTRTLIKTDAVKRWPTSKKTIIIRMPKNTKTEIKVRHGEIKMADAFNVKATLNHTPFTAERIDGGETLINASYAPVVVKDWKFGTLYVKFVDVCTINSVESIQLNANSSDVRVGSISKEAFLTGSFGALIIGSISEDFKRLEIVLKNTDATIKLPKSSFSFLFNGKKSTLKYPKYLELNPSKQDERVLVTGFNIAENSSRNFLINADYSNLVLQ